MFSKCELYYYNGLFLSDEMLEKLNILKTSNIGMLALLESCSNVFSINNGEIIDVDKNKIKSSFLDSEQDYFYIIKNNKLFLPQFVVYYGIKRDKTAFEKEQILSLYNNRKLRDAKLFTLQKDRQITTIIDDMNQTSQVVSEVNKQMKLKKMYESLSI